jgi:peptide subunit release factor 1 (eRF1)
VEESVERSQKAALVHRLRDAASQPGGLAVTGLDAVLKALVERRVETLILSDGYEAPGWRCPGDGLLATKGRACPLCAEDMTLLDDVVEQAVEDALQSCKVVVCNGNADLDVVGRVGALLRF